MGEMALSPYLSLPLEGCHIIEASAGTGKTTALTLMYLSTILEGVPPEGILVVTFTTAAALEVKERIRSLLLSAREFLSGRAPEGFLPEARLLCERSLQKGTEGSRLCDVALLKFDLAPIHTIHAFCRSVLREMSFFLGAPFESTLVTSDIEFKWELAVNLWREMVYGQDSLMAEMVASLWPEGPQSLLPELGERPFESAGSLEGSGALLSKDFEEYLAKRQNFRELFFGFSLPDSPERGKVEKRVEELASDREIPALGLDPSDDLLGPFFSMLGREDLGISLQEAIVAAKRVSDALRGRLPSLLSRQRSLDLVRREQAGVETFDDLISRVASAMDRPDVAPSLREKFPVAFIDEFQDTSQDQYMIFDRIYRTPRPGSALFMIGDPKQSIYRFRGADLSSYLKARERSSGAPCNRLVSLTTNYRSVPSLISAVNAFFEDHPAPFLIPQIPFVPAVPTDRRESEVEDPDHPPGSSLFFFGGKDSKWRLDDFALLAALEIRRLLSGEVRFKGHPVAPSEIAVLVKTRAHGDRIRKQLDLLDIPYSAPSLLPLFHTRESDEFQILLDAILSPWNGSRIMLALSTRLFGWTAQRILQVTADPAEANRVQNAFFQSSRLWRSHGLRASLMDLFFREGVWENLLANPLMMRRIFALLSRVEAAIPLYPFPEDQVSYVERERHSNLGGREEDSLFEEGGEGVRIMTVYKSKGLEFPIVFLPFGLSRSASSKTESAMEDSADEVSSSEEDGAFEDGLSIVDSGSAEDIRLLYVALTRARERLYLFTPLQRGGQTPLKYLLQILPDQDLPGKGVLREKLFACFGEALGKLFQNRPGVVFFPTEILEILANRAGRGALSTHFSFSRKSFLKEALLPASLSRDMPPSRGVTSFTAILRQGRPREEVFWEDPLVGDEADRVIAGELTPEEEPAGPDFGVLVHRILESLGQRTVQWRNESKDAPSLDQVMAWTDALLLIGESGKKENWGEAVKYLVRKALFSPLSPHVPLPLVALFDRRTRFEQSFLCPLPPLEDSTRGGGMASHLRGVIDVVLWVDNKVYLIDYKTNRLTTATGDPYSPMHLGEVLVEHRYNLQASIYSRAFLEHLSLSSSEALFGGFLFLFLRGMEPEGGGSGIFWWNLPIPGEEGEVS
ncbi:MAG: UvrD-helicase domain-containing protein [Leptospirales bacterium]